MISLPGCLWPHRVQSQWSSFSISCWTERAGGISSYWIMLIECCSRSPFFSSSILCTSIILGDWELPRFLSPFYYFASSSNFGSLIVSKLISWAVWNIPCSFSVEFSSSLRVIMTSSKLSIFGVKLTCFVYKSSIVCVMQIRKQSSWTPRLCKQMSLLQSSSRFSLIFCSTSRNCYSCLW